MADMNERLAKAAEVMAPVLAEACGHSDGPCGLCLEGAARLARALEPLLSEARAEGSDRMRGTGGNLFIEPDATSADLLGSINDQLGDLREYAAETGRVLDIAEVTISTRRIVNGRISVTVTADLQRPGGHK